MQDEDILINGEFEGNILVLEEPVLMTQKEIKTFCDIAYQHYAIENVTHHALDRVFRITFREENDFEQLGMVFLGTQFMDTALFTIPEGINLNFLMD